MKHPSETIQAPPKLAELRAKAAKGDDSTLVDLASELLQFSQTLDNQDDQPRAFDAAREGIGVLARTEYADDRDLTALMDALVAQYLSIANRSRLAPDRHLLAPIAVALENASQP